MTTSDKSPDHPWWRPQNWSDVAGLLAIAIFIFGSVVSVVVNWQRYSIVTYYSCGITALIFIGFKGGEIYANWHKRTRVLPNEWKELKQALNDSGELSRLFDRQYCYLSDEGKQEVIVEYMELFWKFGVSRAIIGMKDDDIESVRWAATCLNAYCDRIIRFAGSMGGKLITKEFEDLYNRRIVNRLEPMASTDRFKNSEGYQLWFPRGSIKVSRVA